MLRKSYQKAGQEKTRETDIQSEGKDRNRGVENLECNGNQETNRKRRFQAQKMKR